MLRPLIALVAFFALSTVASAQVSYSAPDMSAYAKMTDVPVAGTGSPTAPVDTITGTPGTAGVYAPFLHTHPSKLRKDRKQTATDGTLTWVYPAAFDVGVIPRCQAIAETADGVTDVINAQIDGTPTNTQMKVRVTRTQKSVVALISLTVLSIPASVGATWVHVQCAEP